MAHNSFTIQKVYSLVFIALLLHIIMNSGSTHPNATARNTVTIGKNETDHLALLAIKSKIVHDPQGVLSSWNESLHFCNWEGVACGRRHRRVISIELWSRGLVGSLSPHVGNLSFLRVLRIYNNTLQGEIPPQVGHLFRLQLLDLNNNYFKGEIPANLSHCYNLMYLRVGFNKLVGKVPEELGSLSRLIKLIIHANYLVGGIPRFITRLTSLESVSAGQNHFTGGLPAALGQLKNLKVLAFGDNQLSGTIHPSIYNLSSLTVLSFGVNQLHGTLPPSLGLMLPYLQLLELGGNKFTGPIPFSISNCTTLGTLTMEENNFNGKLAINFGGLQNLLEIILHDNNLGSGEPDEMNFINSLANCSNFELLELSDNQFRGILPNSVGNLSNQFYFLSLGTNFIHGKLPSAIGDLVNLNFLILDHNRFTGPIPAAIGNLQNLQRAYLGTNSFNGEIPQSIGNLSLLIELYLDENRLVGNIPLSIGNCKKLLLLDLSQNNLSGTIPKQLLRISTLSISLNLSRNRFFGSLPSDVGNLIKLADLDISENGLSGEIPNSLASCTSLVNLYMEGNFFNGSIPQSLSSLRGIMNFDLSRNKLSGKVPRFFEHFSLKNLNLSFNDFEGEVPIEGDFANASVISVVGNSRLCGGIPKLQLPKCNIKESKKKKSSLLLILVISVVCTLLGVTMVVSFWFCWVKKKRNVPPSGILLRESFMKVSYEMLLKATGGFSSTNLIGVGSYGSVYKGILDPNETIVAVKVLNLQRQGASKSFMAECEALRNIRHRNLVKVITSCSSIDFQGNDFKALVYEFMINGSLESWLYPSPKSTNGENDQTQSLNLLQRINVAVDVLSALEYLHHHCETPIIHCDLKPSNVLLDSDMVAHVGDFGLARFLQQLTNPNQSSSIAVRGTVGYAAPEYGLGSKVSTKGDVYSYGILVLEMMTRKRPTDSMFEGGLNIHNFARMALPDRVMEIVDPILLNIDDEEEVAALSNRNRDPEGLKNDIRMECLLSMIKIGVACSMESPQDRMDINDVLRELNLVRKNLQGTQNKS
ncbi:probable LRR receptor-like serine/threonine-protein kinase At3g47570 [Cornus florida]|uniref:probable LRR receptor-like serine/threonine-protein kinase At3g47570 n=1 Tax=Cornus florida TaxID=4283 RepID=UPI0028A1C189|nr:probable LRR receptor-like serine/threonine-protein kinase At3g47570 [Cornus florida]XP_059640567.1 probable LRR receptor-like serine/threonine-protein kinase At3g47570 [Cornus florida]